MYGPKDTGEMKGLAPVASRSRKAPPARSEILVFIDGDEHGVRQPVAFQCCPLGVHLYSRKQVELYRLIEFTIVAPGEVSRNRHISCVGVVAGCRFDVGSSMYRICVKFLDVPKEALKSLEHLSRGAGLLCPYCENY